MAANEDFDGDHLTGGSFSQLLDSDDVVGFNMTEENFIYPSSSFSSGNPPKMPCFGNVCNEGERGFGDTAMVSQKSGITGGSDSSSASSSNNSSSNSFSKSNVSDFITRNFVSTFVRSSDDSICLLQNSRNGDAKTEQRKRNWSGPESVPGSSSVSGAPAESRKRRKRPKTENPKSTGIGKVSKEKIGDRITVLQQLVSPFGKTDTASVLHEAMGYIKFLHDQVQVLSSPYLQRLPSPSHLRAGGENEEDESRYDLRSRGLCLVPVACTVHVANSNGADFWSPAMGNKKH
ncbi:hypothetical protein HHK36_009836 [Tetracentron sinense]|uniref:BHLH domain-containing protein n=2 Tax=Magnoliopsida TaxID=3398 RepID=A0A835DIQ4_TETSI|nr:hypothetical protein HHK36_009836 [Tetracentron sinense]